MNPIKLCTALLFGFFTLCQARTLIFQNKRQETVWVAVQSNPNHEIPKGGGWAMAAGSSVTISVDETWSGQIWGRTGCSFDASGRGSCLTGDCKGKLQCNGSVTTTPATSVDITLASDGHDDYYDVTLDHGFNVPMTVTPMGASPGSDRSQCKIASCPANVNAICPKELQVTEKDNVVACKSPCLAFNTDDYCCREAHGSPQTCNPEKWSTNYAKVFKKVCPNAYSYGFDDINTFFKCPSSNYTITFSSATCTQLSWLLFVTLLISSRVLLFS